MSNSVADALRMIAVRHRWAYRELVYDSKMIEANKLCVELLAKNVYASGLLEERLYWQKHLEAVKLFETVGGMYKYLTQTCTDGDLLKDLNYIITNQSGPRKTLVLGDI